MSSAVLLAALGCQEMEKEGEEKRKQQQKAGESSGNGGTEVDEEKRKLSRKLSQASICSTDNNDEEDGGGVGGGGDSEDEDEEKDLVLLGPQVTLKEQLELDKDDESLRKWKENLLGSVDLTAVGEHAEPEVRILSLTIITPDRPDLTLPLPFAANKGYAFSLKDGSQYRLKFTFTVSNNIVSGLMYTNTVWKTGVKVDSSKVMLGTFSPQLEPYTYELDEETTPSGYFARGSYSARTKFLDDDGKCYLDLSYYFEIRKEWPES